MGSLRLDSNSAVRAAVTFPVWDLHTSARSRASRRQYLKCKSDVISKKTSKDATPQDMQKRARHHSSTSESLHYDVSMSFLFSVVRHTPVMAT
ncbi:hypothetical protein F2P81_008062 [Scophthalmus maximus]|uniref:Uncharacterized protein n=1 Tax=Scophthalmus maximus TaxID=52904 RepID=A0A6A4T198_SCOMX|nr:hypothetical protein F2P81_008062 [Scophthalmus maximus]